jgi:hypothetical protein
MPVSSSLPIQFPQAGAIRLQGDIQKTEPNPLSRMLATPPVTRASPHAFAPARFRQANLDGSTMEGRVIADASTICIPCVELS